MDFWGELPSGEYLLVIIDEYFGYPEVEFAPGTSAQAVKPHLDRVLYTHGFPKMAKTDRGPPLTDMIIINTCNELAYTAW